MTNKKATFQANINSIKTTLLQYGSKLQEYDWKNSNLLWLLISTIVVLIITFRLMTSSQLSRQDLESIAILMTSYPGSSCIGAVETAFKEARYPERVSIFIINAGSSTNPKNSCLKDYDDEYIGSVVIQQWIGSITEAFDMNIGVNAVKSKMIHNEITRNGLSFDFVLEIHGHSLFSSHWDEDAIFEWRQLGNTKAILTELPSRTSEMSSREMDHHGGKMMNILCAVRISDTKGLANPVITYETSLEITPPVMVRDGMRGIRHPIPVEVPFWSSFFSFGPFEYVLEVPNDPTLKTMVEEDGTEFLYSARLRTNGYKMYAAFNDLVYHNYQVHQYQRSHATKSEKMLKQLKKEQKRVDSLLRGKTPEGQSDQDAFGMGNKMTLERWLQIVEVDLAQNKAQSLCQKIKKNQWKS